MLEQLAQYLPEEHRNMEGLLAVATSSQVLLLALSDLTASACSVIAGCVHHICLPNGSGSHTCLQQAECNSPVPMLGNHAIICP